MAALSLTGVVRHVEETLAAVPSDASSEPEA